MARNETCKQLKNSPICRCSLKRTRWHSNTEAMPQLCQELLDVLNRKLQLDDTLRLIQVIVGFRLRSVAYEDDAAARSCGMICEQTQHDIELLLGKGEDGEKWDVVAKWRVWLIFWGHFFDDLEEGELEDGEELTLEEIAAEMDINIIQAGGLYYDADDPGRLQNHDDLLALLYSIQASLIAKVEDLIEPELQKSHAPCTVLNVIRRIAEHPWFERYEIVTAVYLDHITVDARRRHHHIGGTCQKSQVVVEVMEETQGTKAVKVLSIVALNALGDQKCLMSMRVCRGICINTAVHERSKIQLADRVAFTYTYLLLVERYWLVVSEQHGLGWCPNQSKREVQGCQIVMPAITRHLGQGQSCLVLLGIPCSTTTPKNGANTTVPKSSHGMHVLRPYDKAPQGFYGYSLMSCLASFVCQTAAFCCARCSRANVVPCCVPLGADWPKVLSLLVIPGSRYVQ